MNRNTESYFATVPTIDIQRSSFDMSADKLFSFNVGKLVPFYLLECLPGDTHHIETSKVVRLQTLLTPVFSNLYLDTYFFFVPHRLVWNHFKQFMGENSDSAWLPEVSYSIPQLKNGKAYDPVTYTKDGWPVGGQMDYLGVPPNVQLSVNALPYRSLQLIFDTWFRDENLQNPENIYLGDSDSYLVYDDASYAVAVDNNRYPVCKFHDYFTSALPAPLKGDPVLAPVTGIDNDAKYAPVVGLSVTAHDPGAAMKLTPVGSTTGYYPYASTARNAAGDDVTNVLGRLSSATAQSLGPANLYANISESAAALGINIMQLRNAFQVQRLLERDARSGTRYTEIVKGHFSVTSPDSRLQRPEYLGGNRIPISIHQIVNQSQGEQDFLGDLGAMSLTTDRHDDCTYSCTEHGYIIGVCCARYDHSYPQGLHALWSRKTRYDFYWPELAHISEMPIYNKEIFAQGTDEDDEVFGYQEAWSSYRYMPNSVAGELRPGIPNTLASWHFADYYESLPVLGSSWIKEDPTNVDRTLAVTSSVANQLFADIYVKNIATRPMPVRSIPGLADHF